MQDLYHQHYEGGWTASLPQPSMEPHATQKAYEQIDKTMCNKSFAVPPFALDRGRH